MQLFFSQSVPSLQGEEQEGNLLRIADNIKFRNGIQFFSLKKYTRSLEEFLEYLEIYPDGIHRQEAYRHIGIIHYNRFDYIKSLNAYRTLYEEFPNSEEGISALFQTGICYEKMGYKKKARSIYNAILSEHAGSNLSYRAKIQIDMINILLKDDGNESHKGEQ